MTKKRKIGIYLFAALGLGAGAALMVNFFDFAQSIGRYSPTVEDAADGIVVLTGGQSRIAEAVRLLSLGKARRLLISGVERENRKEDVRRAVALAERHLFDCCIDRIDLGYVALDTTGNASEARRWAVEKGFHSLIVVTSSYHMPRSLIEIQHVLPDTRLVPYPVIPRNFRIEAWWAYSGTAHLLFSEYFKYLRTGVRVKLAEFYARTTHSLLMRAGSTEPLAEPLGDTRRLSSVPQP